MAILTVRNVPEDVHRALRVRAAQHGRTTEAEVREDSSGCGQTGGARACGRSLGHHRPQDRAG